MRQVARRKFLFSVSVFLLSLLLASVLCADDSKLKKIIDQGLANKAVLDSFTEEDVPDEWSTTIETKESSKGFTTTYFRGKKKRLMVIWAKEWTGKRAKMFTAFVYDGDKKISIIAHLVDSTSAQATDNGKKKYNQIVLAKDSGGLRLMISNDSGYLECVDIDGRKTHLMDDLEYTKLALTMDSFLKPFVEELLSERKQVQATKK